VLRHVRSRRLDGRIAALRSSGGDQPAGGFDASSAATVELSRIRPVRVQGRLRHLAELSSSGQLTKHLLGGTRARSGLGDGADVQSSMSRLWLCVAVSLAGAISVTAFERDVDDAAIDEAIRIASKAREAEKNAFHRSYVCLAGPPPVSSISLVTEFRRVVLAAEDRLRFGDHLWSIREAREMLRPFRNQLETVVDVNFHPQNAYATVPQYDVRIIPQEGPEIRPLNVNVTAKYGLRSVPNPRDPPYYPFPPPSLPIGPGADPLMGAWVSTLFDATALDPHAFVVIAVAGEGKDLSRVSVDLGRVK
jgi:hypothetical protein